MTLMTLTGGDGVLLSRSITGSVWDGPTITPDHTGGTAACIMGGTHPSGTILSGMIPSGTIRSGDLHGLWVSAPTGMIRSSTRPSISALGAGMIPSTTAILITMAVAAARISDPDIMAVKSLPVQDRER